MCVSIWTGEAFISRTLTSSENNYAQFEKEASALVYGVKTFHTYLYGRHFTLVMDHKPLTTILTPSKSTPPLAAARLQRWALILSAYQYQIEFKPTKKHANADCLSRLPLAEFTREGGDIVAVSSFNLGQVETLPVTARMLATATRNDLLLSKVLKFILHGWPSDKRITGDIVPYLQRMKELTVEGDCFLWGIRVIVPEKYRTKVLQELHKSHCGMFG